MECSDQNTIRGQSAGSPHAGGLTLFDTINTRPDIEYSYNNKIIYILYWLWVLAEPAVTCEVPGLTELVPPRLGVVQAVDVGDEGHLGDQTWTPRDNEDKSSWYFSTYQAVSLLSPLSRVFCPESKALCYIVLHCIITLYYIHSLAFLIV